jgi:hypothetical protein
MFDILSGRPDQEGLGLVFGLSLDDLRIVLLYYSSIQLSVVLQIVPADANALRASSRARSRRPPVSPTLKRGGYVVLGRRPIERYPVAGTFLEASPQQRSTSMV